MEVGVIEGVLLTAPCSALGVAPPPRPGAGRPCLGSRYTPGSAPAGACSSPGETPAAPPPRPPNPCAGETGASGSGYLPAPPQGTAPPPGTGGYYTAWGGQPVLYTV
ncbi:hypothetical protein FKM82_017267 [Ascaphus truei]